MQPRLYRVATALTIGVFSALVNAQDWLTTTDWEQVSTTARSQAVPVVIAVIGDDCGNCELMKREFLSDPTIQSFLGERSLIRIYHRSTGGKIRDFDGERIRARLFTSRYEIFGTPTLLFLDPDGNQIADPLVGYNDPVNYRDLVTGRLDQAQLALQASDGPGSSAVAGTQR